MARKRAFSSRKSKTDPLAMYTALSSSRRFQEEEKVDVILPVRIAFEAISNGAYSDDDIFNLYVAACLGLRVISQSDPLHRLCLGSREFLFEAYEHIVKDGECVNFESAQITDILTTVEIYEALVDQVTPANLLLLIEDIGMQTKKVIATRSLNPM